MIPKKFMYMAVIVVGLFVVAAIANGATPGSGRTEGCNDCAEGCGDSSVLGECAESTGNCEHTPVSFMDGDSGTIDIPFVGAMVADVDAKHHFDVPSGTTKVEVTFRWDPTWSLILDIGTGECPHNGETFASVSSRTGEVTLVYEDSEGLPTGKWFAHLAPADASSHRGESCAYVLGAVLCDCSGECGDCGDTGGGGGSGGCAPDGSCP